MDFSDVISNSIVWILLFFPVCIKYTSFRFVSMPERLPNFDYKVYSQFRKYNELKIFWSVYLQNEGAHVENRLEAIYFFLTLSFLWVNHAPGLEFSFRIPVEYVYWPENVIDWLGNWRPTCAMRHARGQKLQSFWRKWPFCMNLYSVVEMTVWKHHRGSR
jgi:hypothetical protein